MHTVPPHDPRSGAGRDSWFVRTASGAVSDLRHAARGLLKTRGFTTVTLLTLALCIGANTAIFSMVYALMLKPLPYPEPDRIVEIYNTYIKAGLNKNPSNVVQYLDYKQNTLSYDAVGLWGSGQIMVGEDGAAERMSGARMTTDMFQVLGINPLLGNFFTPENSLPGAPSKVVVLTQSFWERQFQEDPAAIGRKLRVEGEDYTIIGVAPRALEAFDARVRILAPLSWPPERVNPQQRHGHNPQLFARLKRGATLGQAQAEAEALEKKFYDAYPQVQGFLDRTGHKIAVAGVQVERVKPFATSLYLLQAGVVLVLLIGCVNVANLLLARANGRQADLAIRFALGASRGVIARHLLIETALLVTLGTIFGVGLAWGAVAAINHFTSQMLPMALPFAIDGRVLGFTIAVSLIVATFIGLLPVVHILRSNLIEQIHRNSTRTSGGAGVRTLSNVLIIGQVAIALVLLAGAGLLIKAFFNATAVNPGFEPRSVITGRIAIPAAHRANEAAARAIQERLVEAMKEIPGVESVALGSGTPFLGGLGVNALTLAEDTLPPGSPQPGAYRVSVSTGYAETLGLTLLEGKFFDPLDVAPGKRTFVVDEDFAKKFFPGQSAIGGRFSFGARPQKDADWPVIIGVVKRVPHNGVEDRSGIPFIYQPIAQNRPGALNLFVRTSRPAVEVISVMREKLRAIDPAMPMFEAGTLPSFMDRAFNNRSAVMLLFGTFAGLALFLSALGIYGVLAYDVSQRTREIGIRGAIGATRAQVVGMILTQGVVKAVIGLVLGLVGAVLLSRYITSLLFEVKPTDPIIYAAVSVVLLAVAALASYLPALRASKIDPMVALRAE